LYYGIVIGIAGLLALFLTILFVVKGSIMFPAAAALGWAVLIYIGIDFGFWGKVFDMSAGAERVWRACGEAILSATLLVFLFAYLNLSRWHVRYAHITIAWLAALAALIAVAVFDPAVAAGIARMSLAGIALLGLALVIYLSTHGFDRAVLLIPTWLLLVVWTTAAGLAVTGVVTNDIIGPALLGGLVLIVMLIGFTVMQHAFAGGITHGIVSDVERRALALTGAGDLIWDWDVSADKVFTSPETEHMLGVKRGTLEGPAATWLEVLHPLDRDRFRRHAQRNRMLLQAVRLAYADATLVATGDDNPGRQSGLVEFSSPLCTLQTLAAEDQNQVGLGQLIFAEQILGDLADRHAFIQSRSHVAFLPEIHMAFSKQAPLH
jgi:PAS domain-containing protein